MAASFSAQIKIDDVKKLGLPILYIETENGKKIRSKTDYRKASWTLESPGENALSGKCKIRGRGNTTWETRELYKKPYLLKLNNPESLLGMAKSEKWVLMANTADKTSLRNSYAEYLARNIFTSQTWIPSSKFIILYINGRFEGLYGLTEKVEMTEGRVFPPSLSDDNPSISAEQNPDFSNSFLAEVGRVKPDEWHFETQQKITVTIQQKTESNDSVEMYRLYQEKIQKAENVLFSEDFADQKTGWQKYLDKDSFIDWYLINEFTKNHDAAFQSSCYFFYEQNSGKFFMGPIWDFDISCGNISYDNCENPEGEFINSKAWYKRLFEDENFKKAVHKRFLEKNDELYESFSWIQEQADKLVPAIKINDAVWKNIGHRQWPHAPGWKNRKTYQAEVDYMIDFLEKRRIWLENEYSMDGENK